MAPDPVNQDSRHPVGFFDLLIVVLSVYVLGALIAETFFTLPKETSRIIALLDNVICLFFLADFVHRLYRAENKLSFMNGDGSTLWRAFPHLRVDGR